jgi:hypothetical protein
MENLSEGTIGDLETPGAPVATFSLVVIPSKNSVSGRVLIKQALNIPDGDIDIKVEGKIHATGFGNFTKVVSLHGQYDQSFPSEKFGAFLADFDAHFVVDDDWNGTGGFSFYKNQIENVPVEAIKKLKEELVG